MLNYLEKSKVLFAEAKSYADKISAEMDKEAPNYDYILECEAIRANYLNEVYFLIKNAE